MIIVSIEIAIAMKCNFVTEKHSTRNLDSAAMHQVLIYKIELSVCNHSHSIPALD